MHYGHCMHRKVCKLFGLHTEELAILRALVWIQHQSPLANAQVDQIIHFLPFLPDLAGWGGSGVLPSDWGVKPASLRTDR